MVYTPLHGTGLMLVEKALEQANFKGLHVVEEQAVQMEISQQLNLQTLKKQAHLSMR